MDITAICFVFPLTHFWFPKQANSIVNCMDLLNAKSKTISFQYQLIFDISVGTPHKQAQSSKNN